MSTINYNRIQFLTSVTTLSRLPADTGSEVAFAGRSNAGKSSALNAITGFKKLARISKTPGRTQSINFFQLENDRRLVDLPGYGYAKVAISLKAGWEQLISNYITKRQSLKGIILLMDIRHPLKPFDQKMIEWTVSLELPMHILLTKSDKFKQGVSKNIFLSVKKELKLYQNLSIQLFSAISKEGVPEVQEKLDSWLT